MPPNYTTSNNSTSTITPIYNIARHDWAVGIFSLALQYVSLLVCNSKSTNKKKKILQSEQKVNSLGVSFGVDTRCFDYFSKAWFQLFEIIFCLYLIYSCLKISMLEKKKFKMEFCSKNSYFVLFPLLNYVDTKF